MGKSISRKSREPPEPPTCGICLEEVSETDSKHVSICNHTFHEKCINKFTEQCSHRYKNLKCPMCRKEWNDTQRRRSSSTGSDISDITFGVYRGSLTEEMNELHHRISQLPAPPPGMSHPVPVQFVPYQPTTTIIISGPVYRISNVVFIGGGWSYHLAPPLTPRGENETYEEWCHRNNLSPHNFP